jgi:hypothetical protein
MFSATLAGWFRSDRVYWESWIEGVRALGLASLRWSIQDSV